MTAIHTRVSTEYLPTWNILTVAGRVSGPVVSASRWLHCVLAILYCWRPICTASDVEIPPLVHIAMVLMRWQNIWCYTAQLTPGAAGVMTKSPLSKRPKTPKELPGEDRGGDPSPWPGMRERESLRCTTCMCHVLYVIVHVLRLKLTLWILVILHELLSQHYGWPLGWAGTHYLVYCVASTFISELSLMHLCGVCVEADTLSQQPTGRHSTPVAHGQSDMGGLQHIPENQFPPYATISKGVDYCFLFVWCICCLCVLRVLAFLI